MMKSQVVLGVALPDTPRGDQFRIRIESNERVPVADHAGVVLDVDVARTRCPSPPATKRRR
jgi:hypothetical protein